MGDFEKELEEARAARKLNEQQMEANFDTDVQTRFERFKAEFQERMKKSLDIKGGRANEIKRWANVFNGEQPDTLAPRDRDLHTAWTDIQSGFIYRGGKPNPEQIRKYKALPPRLTQRDGISERDWLEFANVYPSLRTLHIEAIAAQRLLEWLRALQEQPEPVAEHSAPAEPNEASTGAEIERKLTSWQAAYLLAYRKTTVIDPRNRGENAPARVFARDLCNLTADNSGYQLYQRTTYLRSAKDRDAFFNSAVDAFHDGNKYHDKSPKSFLKDVETIIPLLEGEQKSEAKADLKKWNAMI